MLLKSAIRFLLFRKAGEQLGLFDIPVPIKPYVRDGKVIAGHVAKRKKRIAPKGKQPDLFGVAEPKGEAVKLGRLGHFIEKHGGYGRLHAMLQGYTDDQRNTLLDSMAKLAGKTRAEVADILANGAKHEAPKAPGGDLFDGVEAEAHKDNQGRDLAAVKRTKEQEQQRAEAGRVASRAMHEATIKNVPLPDWTTVNGQEVLRSGDSKFVAVPRNGKRTAANFDVLDLDTNEHVLSLRKDEVPPWLHASAKTEFEEKHGYMPHEAGPKEGDTKTENGIEYRLQDGRWHRTTPEEKPAFIPTHELPDGTQVIAHADEANVWVDAQGDEYESEEAYPLSPQDPVRDTAREKLDTAKEAGVITPDEHQAASEALDSEGPAAAKAAIDRKRKADKLRKVAQNLMDKAQAAQNQDRNTNTARRASMAQNILARAAHEEATARTMLNLADAIEAGEAPHLEGMNSMAAVQTLDAVLHRARSKYEEVNGWTYDRSKKEQGRPWGEDDIRHVMWPDTTIRKDWIPSLQGDLRQARGGKALADEVRHGNLTQDLYDRMVNVLGEHKVNGHVGWYAADRLKDIARLKRAGITGTEDLQAAVREYVQFKAGRKAIDPVKAAEMALAGQKVGIDFFPTPKALADRMAELADIEPGMKVLEPSAGKGNLADAAKARGADVDVVEVSDALRNVLQAKGYALVDRDFNDFEPGEVYDRIIMNPPFGKGTDRQDAAHIQRAYQMLKPGGKLVAIAGEGVFIGSDQKAVAFRDWLNQRGAMIEKLPDNSFMDRAETHVTGAATRLVVIEKPEGAKQEDEAPRMRTYGWDAVKLSDAYTMEELDALRQQVEREHENPKDANGHPLENGRSSIYLYDKKGRQKLDKIGWAVKYKLDEKRRQEASKPDDAHAQIADKAIESVNTLVMARKEQARGADMHTLPYVNAVQKAIEFLERKGDTQNAQRIRDAIAQGEKEAGRSLLDDDDQIRSTPKPSSPDVSQSGAAFEYDLGQKMQDTFGTAKAHAVTMNAVPVRTGETVLSSFITVKSQGKQRKAYRVSVIEGADGRYTLIEKESESYGNFDNLKVAFRAIKDDDTLPRAERDMVNRLSAQAFGQQQDDGGGLFDMDDGPQEGERNAEGLVFHDGRWHREDDPASSERAFYDVSALEGVPKVVRDDVLSEINRAESSIRRDKEASTNEAVYYSRHSALQEIIKRILRAAGYSDGDARAIKDKLLRPSMDFDTFSANAKDDPEARTAAIDDQLDAEEAQRLNPPEATPEPTPEPTRPDPLERLRAQIETMGGKVQVAENLRTAFQNRFTRLQADAVIKELVDATGLDRDTVLAEMGIKEVTRKPAGERTRPDTLSTGGEYTDDDPNSPNYRFRDTGYIGDSRKELAAESIREHARNGQRLRATDIDWQQIEQNPRQAKELITKSNLFGKVDWEALKANGMGPATGFLIDRVYASIAPEPSADDAQARKDYAVGLETLRDRLESCKTPENVTEVLEELRDEYDGIIFNEREKAAYESAREIYQEISNRRWALKQELDALQQAAHRITGKINTLSWQQEKRERRKWKRDPDIDRQIDELRPAQEAAIQAVQDWKGAHPEAEERYETQTGTDAQGNMHVRSRLTGELYQKEQAAYEVMQTIKAFSLSRNREENPLHRAWRLMGPKFLTVLKWRSGKNAFQGHVTSAKTGKIKDWSWAEKQHVTAPRSTEGKVRFQLRVAENFSRVGGRPVEVNSTDELKRRFGLRDVQSGNWVLTDPESAAFHVQHAAEALSDLSDLLGIPEDKLFVNGRVALAFGARGTGNAGFGGAARAHYERIHRVINLTKMGGGGALAHELFHAIDNLAKEAETGQPGDAEDFITDNPDLLPDGPLKQAVRGLRSAMLDGDKRLWQTLKYTANDARLAKHNLDRAAPSKMAAAIKDAADLESALLAIDGFYPNGWISKRTEKHREEWRRIAAAWHDGMKPEGGKALARAGAPVSDFTYQAHLLDGGQYGKYWSTTREMAARAFQAWCEDRLSDQGRKNDYLSAFADNQYYKDPIFGDSKPFPEGRERERINAAIDDLVYALRESGTLRKAFELLAA